MKHRIFLNGLVISNIVLLKEKRCKLQLKFFDSSYNKVTDFCSEF